MVRVALPATFKIRTDFRGEKIHDSYGQLFREVGYREAVGCEPEEWHLPSTCQAVRQLTCGIVVG